MNRRKLLTVLAGLPFVGVLRHFGGGVEAAGFPCDAKVEEFYGLNQVTHWTVPESLEKFSVEVWGCGGSGSQITAEGGGVSEGPTYVRSTSMSMRVGE